MANNFSPVVIFNGINKFFRETSHKKNYYSDGLIKIISDVWEEAGFVS